MEHAERYDMKGSCGGARVARVVEQEERERRKTQEERERRKTQEERERRKTQSTWDPPSHVPSMWDSSSHYAKTTL
jgi:hypothetical protein